MTKDKKRYIAAFLITVLIFITAFFISDYFNQKRIASIRDIEEKISTNILSLETQFELLEESSCSYIKENPLLSKELNTLSKKLSFMEEELGSKNPEVVKIKKTYSLLEIKDYLLMKKIDEKCKINPVYILYFYSNEGDCKRCNEMGYVLTYLREQYPKLRVYSFDYNIELSALNTLISIKEIEPQLPAIMINENLVYGFQDLKKMEEMLPIEKITSTTTASTTNDKK